MIERIFHLHALSALHAGTGQGIGVVDLPIARARATHLPLVPGSSLKGALRDDLTLPPEISRNTLFGPDNSQGDSHAGALAVGDAHLLILPVRAFSGIVAFATCPFILRRYLRDCRLALNLPQPAKDSALVCPGSELPCRQQIMLEDLDLTARSDDATAAIASAIAQRLHPEDSDWQETFRQHFVILPDSVFSFLADTATEIRARIKINDDTRVVQDGALWYEENLPAETVLWGIVGISRARDKSQHDAETLAQALPVQEVLLQIGGKHTVGRGLCRFLVGRGE